MRYAGFRRSKPAQRITVSDRLRPRPRAGSRQRRLPAPVPQYDVPRARARLNRLRLLGWTVLRFTADDVLRHPERVVAQVRNALAL
jgi:hypothetical protein